MAHRTQAERRAATRGRLLAAAGPVFAARGFHAASVGEIAEAAGCSTGALYAHFGSKEKLFLTLLQDEIPPWGAGYATDLENAGSSEARVRAGVEHWSALLEQHPYIWLLFFECWSVAVRDPELRPLFAQRYAEIRKVMAELWEAESADHGGHSPLSADELAAAITALADGFALQRLADPDAIPDELVLTAMRLLEGLAPQTPS